MRFILTTIFLFITHIGFAQLCGRVVSIADGDTFTLLTEDKKQVKVRLYGIDCPEKGQNFSEKAKQYSSSCIFGKEITVIEKDIDRYGRIVGIAMVNDTISLNELLLANGFAWHYTQYD